MFGSLFMKTFRVYKIFGNKSLSKVKVSATDIVKAYGGILAVDIALLLGWALTGDGMTNITVEKELAGFWTYETVECNISVTWEFGTTFFKVMMVVVGVYLAYITRNVPDKFAEAKWIALSIYQVFLLGTVGLLVKSSAPESLLLVQGICVPAAAAVTCCCIFGPKWLMNKYPHNYEDTLKTSVHTSSGPSSTVREETKDQEILALRATVKELEAKFAQTENESV